MTAFNRILDTVRIKAPGVVDSAILLELFAAVDFACRRGDIYIDTVTIPLVVGTYEYNVPAPAGVSAVPTAVFSLGHVSYPTHSANYDPDLRRIILVDVIEPDDAALPLYATAKFVPDPAFTLTANAVQAILPAFMWDRHFGMLIDGTLARLFAQIAKPYSNPNAATLHARLFRNALSQAKSEQVKGHKPGGQTWSFPAFA